MCVTFKQEKEPKIRLHAFLCALAFAPKWGGFMLAGSVPAKWRPKPSDTVYVPHVQYTTCCELIREQINFEIRPCTSTNKLKE